MKPLHTKLTPAQKLDVLTHANRAIAVILKQGETDSEGELVDYLTDIEVPFDTLHSVIDVAREARDKVSDYYTIEHTLPNCWASAIFNGDESGLSEADIEELNHYMEKNGHPNFTDAKDHGFCTHNDAGTLAGDCSIYTALYEKADPV